MKDTITYDLPESLIAQHPLKKREKARLMVLCRESGKIRERSFPGIISFFGEGDVLALNNSRVIPARLKGRKSTGGRVEVFLLKKAAPFTWEVLLRGNIREGHSCIIENPERRRDFLRAVIRQKKENGSYIAEFDTDDDRDIFKLGDTPLPPYIKREADAEDAEYYQTVYAEKDGSVAAHTAGLHFTPELLDEVAGRGVKIVYLTLHIGWSSFRLLKSEGDKVGEEFFEIGSDAADTLNEAKEKGRKVFAVGTSTVRALESAAEKGKVNADSRYTGLFIRAGHDFQVVDRMITNFHLPGSTHLFLVCGFAGTGLVERAYKMAVEKEYRFYSYGDAMLII